MGNVPYGFDIYLVNVKTIRQIVQIFVAFSQKLNFNTTHLSQNHVKNYLADFCTSERSKNQPSLLYKNKMVKLSEV